MINTCSSSSEQTKIPTEFICFLCKFIFNEPLLLSCGHSFCRKCLQPWLQKSTNCPYCRSNTLSPLINTFLEEKISNFKKQNANIILSKENNEKGCFIRSFVRRSVRPTKEPQTLLQREALRASQRKPNKGIVLPDKIQIKNSIKVDKENVREIKKDEKNKEKEFFPRMGGNLRQSFARFRGKKAKTHQKTYDCLSNTISSFSQEENIFLNQQNKGEYTSSSSGFSLESTHSNNKNINRLRGPSLGVSGSIIARRASNQSENIKIKTKIKLEKSVSGDTNASKGGCLIM